MQAFQSRPKIDLHRHREGAIRLSTLLELAPEIPGLPFNRKDLAAQVMLQPCEARSASVFLSKFAAIRHFYVSKEIIDRTTTEVIEDAAADNIVYLELRVSPTALTAAGAGTFIEVLDWLQQATQKAASRNNMQVQLIALMNRHESFTEAARFVDAIIERTQDGYCGIDLAGDETRFPGTEFISLFAKAKKNRLGLCVHAGEWAPAENVRTAILDFQADRIGHGCRVMEDATVVHLAKAYNIPFEVCLTSNVLSGVVPGMEVHPVRSMQDAGLQITLNTDDPSIQQTNLTSECVLAVSQAGLTTQEVIQCMLNAARAAFLPEAQKENLVQQISAGWSDCAVSLE